ncbi:MULTISPECIES: PAS domain-containing sensor histidine kinase [Halorubrum]|uniref:histidine kinase n=1 Tax=Halorubrum hochstenium ATCC 700873 TaxID=1227481 RepID=M0FF25_9EURY|nr:MULTISPECIES: PAS domain S-box protein [Halorubrum]ELZ58515.1 PAS/PAC sensor protein [Halorubrum hochstenium ATCC 700873]
MSRSPEPETLIDLAQDKIAVIDERGRFRYLSAATEELLGFDPDELVGRNAFDLVHPDDVDRVRAAFESIVADGTRSDSPVEYRYATADGDWVWFRTLVFPPAETGIDGYALSSRDITLEVESRRRLETIASTSPDVLWMFSADWTELLFVNGAVEPVFGIDPDALDRRPRRFLESVHPDDRPAVERAMERLSAGESTNLDYRVGSPDGPTSWVRVPGRPVTEGGEVVAVTGFARDVTDEYRRERQLTVMDNLLRHTIRNDMNIVDGTAERIADRVRDAAGPSASSASPTLDGSDSSASESVDSEADFAELAADVIEHAETVRRVADDLLTTAEKQRGVIDLLRQHEPPQPLRVAPLVESAVADAVGDPGDSPVGVSVSCPDGARAFTHPELDYAIAELIENAIEHAEATPTVEIEVTVPADRVEIAVRDNGPPIPPAERDPITDRWRMDDLRHTDGMGLWLVYWIADRSGGDLRFDTGVDGNEVTISVPDADRDPASTTADGRPSAVSGGGSAAEPDGGGAASAAGLDGVAADRDAVSETGPDRGAASETATDGEAAADPPPGSTDG